MNIVNKCLGRSVMPKFGNIKVDSYGKNKIIPYTTKQVRVFEIKNGEVQNYKVIKGSEEDWDERVYDEISSIMSKNGKYQIIFYTDSKRFGDAILDPIITKLK